MKNKERKKSLKIIIIAVVIGVFILFILLSLNKKPQPLTQQYLNQPQIQNSQFKTHTSQDLKISFRYPRGWYVDDRDQLLLLTNYQTSLNKNDHPSPKQIELVIHRFSYCFRNIEDDLINPACGEGGIKARNKIVSKEVRQTQGGMLYKYIVSSSTDKQLIFYLLQKGEEILQISKQPNPSQYEKEFEEIINSITFL